MAQRTIKVTVREREWEAINAACAKSGESLSNMVRASKLQPLEKGTGKYRELRGELPEIEKE